MSNFSLAIPHHGFECSPSACEASAPAPEPPPAIWQCGGSSNPSTQRLSVLCRSSSSVLHLQVRWSRFVRSWCILGGAAWILCEIKHKIRIFDGGKCVFIRISAVEWIRYTLIFLVYNVKFSKDIFEFRRLCHTKSRYTWCGLKHPEGPDAYLTNVFKRSNVT